MSGHHPGNPADQYYNYPSTTPTINTTEAMPDLYQMVMDLGIPACVIIAAFWFIRYQSELAKKEREEFWNAQNQTATTNMKGECKLTPRFGCSGTRKTRLWVWKSSTHHFGIGGTLEVQAEGFQLRRISLFDLVDADKVTGDKSPLDVHVDLTRDMSDN